MNWMPIYLHEKDMGKLDISNHRPLYNNNVSYFRHYNSTCILFFIMNVVTYQLTYKVDAHLLA